MAIANKLRVLAANHVLKHDNAQAELAHKLDRLAVLARTFHFDKQKYLLQSRHDLLLPKGVKSKFTPPRMPRGLFITGKVGTGKSMLMNLFLDELNVPYTRVHFHSFLEHINRLAFAKRERGKSTFDILQDYGDILARENTVFALDEFLFPDAGSNTMLQPVLEAVMKQSILVCTSNLPEMPDYLTCKLVNMNQDQDYRSLAVDGRAGPCQMRTYPTDEMTDQNVQVGRLTVPLANLSKKIGLVDFSQVFASESYSVPEYSLLCDKFDLLVITECPVFRVNKTKATQVARNANARFFCFLDMAYERGIKLVLCSQQDDLFPSEEESITDDLVATAAFKRAKSRWMEMSQEEV